MKHKLEHELKQRPCYAPKRSTMEAERPEIDYPCQWTYQIIGQGEALLRGHIEATLLGLEHELEVTRTSTSGRYSSIRVTLVVSDEAQRLKLGAAFQQHPAVRIVL
jgi:uncharacterized protein